MNLNNITSLVSEPSTSKNILTSDVELTGTLKFDTELIFDGKLDGEAQVFHIPGAQGDIGFISSVTQPFCSACTRARLTADGKLRLCLLREKEVDLLTPLRAGASEEELRRLILDGIWGKPWGHGLADGVIPLNRIMSEIGG